LNHRIYLLLCSFAAIAAPASLIAADSIHGTVRDRSGTVIQGASVQLLSGSRIVTETKTGTRGEYSITFSADGPYVLLGAASGFEPAYQTLSSADGRDREMDIVLEIAPYHQSIEIIGSLPLNEAVLDMSGVRESSAKDLGEALTALDGVWKIRKAGIANDLVIRGFQQNNIAVLVDGSRTFAACPSHMDPPAQHVDFAEVDHVELTKGAFDVTNQGSLGATVNIITKSPGQGFSLKPSVSFGSFGFVNPSVTASYGSRLIRVLGGYSFRTSEAYKDGSGRRFTDYAAYSADGKRQNAFDINTGWLETQFSITDRQELTLGYTRQQSGLILYPYLTMDSDYDNADRGTFKYTARDISPALRNLRVEGYFTQVKHFMSDSQRTSAMMGRWMMASDASTRAVGGRVEGDFGRNLTAGVESYYRNWNLLGYMKMSGMTKTNPSIPDVDTHATGSFVNYRRSLTERLKLTGGVRFDHVQMQVSSAQASTSLYYQFHDTRRTANNDNYVSGNLRLSLALPKSTELFAGIGTTGRTPDAEERYISRGMGSGATVGNPLLPVTRNTEVTTGWSITGRRAYWRPALFYSFLNDFIVVNNQTQMKAMGMGGMTVPTARSYENVDARIYGGEMAYGVTLTSALSLNGGGAYSRGLATRPLSATVPGRYLPEMPPLRAWTSLRYTHRWAFAELGTVAVNRQPLVDRELKEQPTPGYALLSLKLGFTHRRLSGSLAVDNLLDRLYYEHLSYYRDPFSAGVKVPEPGRNYFAQLRYSF
jgi:iron complex outermembrane receptor protein